MIYKNPIILEKLIRSDSKENSMIEIIKSIFFVSFKFIKIKNNVFPCIARTRLITSFWVLTTKIKKIFQGSVFWHDSYFKAMDQWHITKLYNYSFM